MGNVAGDSGLWYSVILLLPMNMCWLSKISDGRLGVANVVMHGRRLLATAAAIFLSFFSYLFIYLFIYYYFFCEN